LRDLHKVSGPEDVVLELRSDVEVIRSAAVRACQTIKDLLTLSRQGKTSKEPLDLNEVVKSCLEGSPLRFVSEARQRVSIEVEESREPLLIRASEAHLARALTNLVRNSIEAVSELGHIHVRTEAVRVQEPLSGYETVPPGDYARVSVIDDGLGIPARDLPRIFEPFFSSKRMDDSTGTGLGLAIVHGVVKDHEGFLDVVSESGRGTTFTLYFPRIYEAARSSAKSCPVPRAPARILIVDDEPVQLRTARRVLRHLGYHVDIVSSGSDAYAKFAERPDGESPYDLVILDMLLNEDEDGLDVLDQIQQLYPQQAAILASGHAPGDRAELAVEKGLAWLVKPYTMETLARAVQAALPPPLSTSLAMAQ
jgi:CheY-like chemotaxis protein